MKKNLLIFALLFVSVQLFAQQKRSIDVLIGLGITAPSENIEVFGQGFYLQGEYVYEISKWVDLRPYAGLILTKTVEPDLQQYKDFKVSTNAFLLGGKVRLTLPIPWVAPYIELGIGASIGKFKTITNKYHIEDSGLTYHLPFSLGIKLGKNHQTDLAFTYYIHNDKQQFAGALAIGFSIPLNK